MELVSLVGLFVTEIGRVHDYLRIGFEDGSWLNVFNRFEIAGDDISTLDRVKGQRLVSVDETPEAIEFEFGDGTAIRVGMTNDDFLGPEAMVYADPDGKTLVWN
jgi:hypothetical protein